MLKIYRCLIDSPLITIENDLKKEIDLHLEFKSIYFILELIKI